MNTTLSLEVFDALVFFGIQQNHYDQLIKSYREPHRFYHNLSHIQDITNLISEKCATIPEQDRYILFAAALYHDAVYDVIRKDNEEKSAALFKEHATKHLELVDTVCKIILSTKNHVPATALESTLCDFDLYGLKYGDFQRILRDERNIMLEYQRFEYADYVKGRIEFLENFIATHHINESVIRAQIEYIKFRKLNIGIYAGSFKPFHKGHLNILEKAEKIFDKVIIARGINPSKKNLEFQDWNHLTKYREVNVYDGSLVTYLKTKEEFANVTLIRGLRSGKDLDHEVNQLRFIHDADKSVKVAFIQCDKEFEHISSSAIRELLTISDMAQQGKSYYK